MVNPEIPLDKVPMDSPTLDIRSMANPGHPLDKVSVDSMDTLTYILHTLDIHNITNPWIPLDKVSKVSLDTLPRDIHWLGILCMSNNGQSIHGVCAYFAKGYPWVGNTMYVQHWSEYPWNPFQS